MEKKEEEEGLTKKVDRDIVYGFTLYDDFDFSFSLFYSGLNSLKKKKKKKKASKY